MTNDLPEPSAQTALERPTADIEDAYRAGGRLRSCEIQFRQYGRRKRFSGVVRTVSVFEDNALVKAVLREPGGENVLVVDGGGSLRAALMGDTIAALAQTNGWAGVIIFGAVRDVEALATIDIGIKALGSNPWKSGKAGAGFVDIDVFLGNARFAPGSYVYSDDDGILIADARLA
jgi:regulator of ribonuclease activity A